MDALIKVIIPMPSLRGHLQLVLDSHYGRLFDRNVRSAANKDASEVE